MPVSAEIEMIERVLQNLILNALQHTPADGEVVVEAAAEGDAVRVSVSDTGCGIPAEDLPYIFDRFYRARNNASARDQGAGLGLAIAKRLVELHGRTIRAESVLNAGTTLAFSLPSATFAEPPSGTHATDADLGG